MRVYECPLRTLDSVLAVLWVRDSEPAASSQSSLYGRPLLSDSLQSARIGSPCFYITQQNVAVSVSNCFCCATGGVIIALGLQSRPWSTISQIYLNNLPNHPPTVALRSCMTTEGDQIVLRHQATRKTVNLSVASNLNKPTTRLRPTDRGSGLQVSHSSSPPGSLLYLHASACE